MYLSYGLTGPSKLNTDLKIQNKVGFHMKWKLKLGTRGLGPNDSRSWSHCSESQSVAASVNNLYASYLLRATNKDIKNQSVGLIR